MQKISSRDAAALLKQAGAAIRDLVSQNQSLREEKDQAAHDARVVKLAQKMEEEGLGSELTLAEKVAHLRKVPDLDVTERAVELAAPQGDLLGKLGEAAGAGDHPFVTFINTGEDVR